MFNYFDYGKKYFYIHIMKYLCLQTCSLERSDLIFVKNMCITRLLQQHIFITLNMFEPHVVYFEYR